MEYWLLAIDDISDGCAGRNVGVTMVNYTSGCPYKDLCALLCYLSVCWVFLVIGRGYQRNLSL